MPNWKKVLTSGSAGELASLYATSITGSLQGTASWAVSASNVNIVAGTNITINRGSNGSYENIHYDICNY